MKVFLFRQYDRFAARRVHEFSEPIGRSLCRNAEPFGCPADERSMKVLERTKEVSYSQFQTYAQELDIPATGKKEELRASILEAVTR